MTGEVKFPFSLTPLKEADQKAVMDKFLGYSGGLVEVEGQRHVMPSYYANFANKYYNFKFRKDDVLIMTFPRSGTTWTQEIVWLMRNNIDIDTASNVALGQRSPFIEFDSLHPPHIAVPADVLTKYENIYPDKDPKVEGPFLGLADSAPSPRTLKTHLPLSLINPKILDTCKIIYVARNPKDSCVSYYHQQRLVKVAEFTGDFAEYVDFWCRDQILQAPYWSHISEAWAVKDHPNVHFMFYENMKTNTMQELQALDTFLGTNLEEDKLTKVAHYTDFSNMKSRQTPFQKRHEKEGLNVKGEADFFRKGVSGDWRNYFTPELENQFQQWLSKGGEIVRQMPFQYQ